MKIAIIGAGNIGRAVGRQWQAAGHTVTFGVRDLERAQAQPDLAGAAVATVAAAVAASAVVLVAVPSGAVGELAAALGDALNDKVVIDATNDFGAPVMNALPTLQALAPGAQLVRAFNSLGWENFAQPRIGDVQLDLLYCSAAGAAQSVAEELIAAAGLRPVRVGGLEQAALVDVVGALWGALVFGQGHSRRLAFKVLAES